MGGLQWLASLALLCFTPAVCRLGSGEAHLTGSSFAPFMRGHDKVLVDFYDKSSLAGGFSDGPSMEAELQDVIRQVRSFGSKVAIATVDASAEPELAKRYVANYSLPQLMWFVHGEPTQYHRTLRTVKSVVDFISSLDRDPIMPVASEKEVSNFNRAVFAQVRKGTPTYHVLEVVAAKYLDTVAFTYLDSSKNNLTWIADDTAPLTYTGEVTVASLDSWVRSRLTKSEPIPDTPSEAGGSLVVVGKTFEELVLREDKDVYLFIYASWCGFSRKFFPVWEALARRVSQIPHLVVARMDGDNNGSPLPELFSWHEYPTVFFCSSW